MRWKRGCDWAFARLSRLALWTMLRCLTGSICAWWALKQRSLWRGDSWRRWWRRIAAEPWRLRFLPARLPCRYCWTGAARLRSAARLLRGFRPSRPPQPFRHPALAVGLLARRSLCPSFLLVSEPRQQRHAHACRDNALRLLHRAGRCTNSMYHKQVLLYQFSISQAIWLVSGAS